MPTSTFPMWWSRDTIVKLLNAARDGESYQELDAIAQKASGSSRPPKLGEWVRGWKDRPTDRPQARLAEALANYDPPSSQETAAMRVVEAALRIHREVCECGGTKDDPGDETCRACAVLEAAEPSIPSRPAPVINGKERKR